MEKKIIVRAAAGLGNQMFMYAHALALSKELNYELYIDDTSAYFQKKNRTHHRVYRLYFFNLSARLANSKYKFDNYFLHNLRKIYIILDEFKLKKSFLIEHQSEDKITSFKKSKKSFSDIIFAEGYFQSEKYFLNIRNDLIKEFTIKNKFVVSNNKYINMLKDSNSVSIHIRRDRFAEPENFSDRGSQVVPHIKLDDVFDYIHKSVTFFETKISNPRFFIWSNNFDDLEKVFDKKKFIFVENNNTAMDFYLFSFAKHFIVSPSSFHWWAAWLNTNNKKICVRPSNFTKTATNVDFWPESWIKI